MLVDTSIFIDLLRQKQQAKDYLLQLKEPIRLSRIVQMELIAGTRTQLETEIINKLFVNLQVEIVEINEKISALAGELYTAHFHKHGLGAMDAFIAATAIKKNEQLATHNIKHFKQLDDLKLVLPY